MDGGNVANLQLGHHYGTSEEDVFDGTRIQISYHSLWYKVQSN